MKNYDVIDFEIAKMVYGDQNPDLANETTRKVFFAVWAFAILEMEEALKRERQIRGNIALRKLRDLVRRVTSL